MTALIPCESCHTIFLLLKRYDCFNFDISNYGYLTEDVFSFIYKSKVANAVTKSFIHNIQERVCQISYLCAIFYACSQNMLKMALLINLKIGKPHPSSAYHGYMTELYIECKESIVFKMLCQYHYMNSK